MPSYSRGSRDKLDTCNLDLQTLFNEVIKFYDCTIIEGHRPFDKQMQLYAKGLSKVLQGKHNDSPSNAVDAGPYINGDIPWPKPPANWNDKTQRTRYMKELAQFYHFAGVVQGVADLLYERGELAQKIRWGGDWDRDHDLADQTFDDLVHFETL